MSTATPLSVLLSPDFAPNADQLIPESFGLAELLSSTSVTVEVGAEMPAELDPELADSVDALLLMDHRVSAATVTGAGRLRLVARYGVGTNSVDLDACTEQGIIVTVTPEGVTRPVASSALALLLALSHRLPEKAAVLAGGRWAARGNIIGVGLTGRTVGIVGFGRTGRELARLLQPFGARLVCHDPFVPAAEMAGLGVEKLELDDLVREADMLCLLAALTPDTHHLMSRQRLASLKPGAILINVSRGPLIDEDALLELVANDRLGGLGLDVFAEEPVGADHPLLALAAGRNIVLTPHSLCWTDECFLGNGRSAARAVLDVAAGRLPAHIANPTVLAHPRVQQLRRAGAGHHER